MMAVGRMGGVHAWFRRSGAAIAAGALIILSKMGFAAFPDVVERVKPSVVVVGSYSTLRSPQFIMKGTGFVVGNGNQVVTNAHVVGDGGEPDNAVLTLMVYPGSGGRVQLRRAERVTVDRTHDLALLRFDGDALPVLPVTDGGAVREGQAVAFTGFPIGGALGYSPVTHRGNISSITAIAMPAPTAGSLNEKVILSVRRGSFSIYQLDATAYPGNSGSPVFDAESGEVVGVVNSVFVKSTRESMLSQPSGISYAIPSVHVQALIQGAR